MTIPICLLFDGNGNTQEIDDAAVSCIHELFEQQAELTPNHLAVVFGDTRVTYRDLNERANRLAYELHALGVGAETLVAVYLERGIDLVAAILAILKAGGAYLPIDPECPRERLAFMIQDASVGILLTQESLLSNVSAAPVQRVVVDTDCRRFASRPVTNPPATAQPRNLAYVMYTSGSTGMPKGVLVEHRSVVHLFRATQGLFQFGTDDVWTLFHSVSFDFSVWEIWGALLYGGRLVVVPRALTRSPDGFYELLEQEKVTVLNQTPSAFCQLTLIDQEQRTRRMLALRYIIFGGERLHLPSLQLWFDHHGDQRPRLINMYGITETTVHVTFRTLEANDARNVSVSPVGRPIPGYRVTVLDGAREPTPVGEVGEIYVGGAGIARGYLNRSDLTAERFIPDPSGDIPGARLYRSGDLGRVLPNGEIEYIGRNDRQVKLRGYRIELGEIESVLNTHEAVAQCMSVVRHDEPAGERLVAYWVPRGGAKASNTTLRAHVAAQLPEFMIPAAFVELARLPLNINGKRDQDLLPAPVDTRPAPESAYVAPRDALEEQLASLWSELLGVERVGVHDNFFELGGHSLLATRAAVRIRYLMEVALPLTALFEHSSVDKLAFEIAHLRCANSSSLATPIPRLNQGVGAELPLSFAQQGLWFLHQLDVDLAAYHITESFRLDGILDVTSLRRAFQTIVERHAPLRTTFRMVDGKPAQVVGAIRQFDLSVHDLRDLVAPAQEEVATLARESANRPFDLMNDILLRVTLIRLREAQHVLLFTLHHIASDGWSLGILRRELGLLYREYRRGETPQLTELSVEYTDYVAWQRHSLHDQRRSELLTYWRAQLANLSALELPADRPPPARFTYHGAEHAFSLPGDLTTRLQTLGQDTGVTLQMILLAAYLSVLFRISGQLDLVVGTPVAGRNHVDLENLIGLFVNILVLRVDLSGDPTFRELLGRVRAASLGAYDHQELPFEVLVDELQPARLRSRRPVVQVLFQLMQFDDRPPSLAGLEVTPLASHGQAVRFDLELHLWQDATGLRGTIVYSTDLFDAATIERIARHYRTVLDAVVVDGGRRISELPVLLPAQREELLLGWSGVAANCAPEGSIPELFEEQVERNPNAVAVVYEDRQLTYGQLNQRANQLAHRLRALGVQLESTVAVYLKRSPDMVVAMLGILKAGGAYLPLDLESPKQRLAFIMQDARVETVITHADLRQDLPRSKARVVCLERDGAEPTWGAAVGPRQVVGPTNLAYVMYTSGSTGQPNGVCVPHRAVTRLVRSTDYLRLNSSDRIAQAASTSFDAATFEIWGGLLNGAQVMVLSKDVILSPSRLHREIRERGITVMFLTTALFNQLAAAAPRIFAPLRCLLFGGETADPSRVRSVLEHDPPGQLLHVYGPTENTTFSTFFDVTTVHEKAHLIPIGRPIANTTCYVLDGVCGLTPVGVAGELYLGGAGLASGYLNRPGLTAERFVDNPFAQGQRLYRTGDRVRWNNDGHLEFLGRMDHQVKLRGYRVELGEITSALRAHEGVEQCEVLLREDCLDLKRLVAYWVPHSGQAVTAAVLRNHLRERLPDYMVPTAFVQLTALPLTANAKLDRAALPPPPLVPAESGGDDAAARRPLEQALAETWASVLGVNQVSVHDNFFDVGGNSLLALRLVTEIEKTSGRHVSLTTLFSHSTIASLVDFLKTEESPPAPSSIVKLRRGGSKPPLYFPPGICGDIFTCSAILEELPPDQPVYAVRRISDRSSPHHDLEAMALSYCEEVMAFQPEGPLLLAGYSFAGLLAYEMARNLIARGRQVKLLAIIDTGPHDAPPRGSGEVLYALWLFLRNLPRWIPGTLLRVPAREFLAIMRRTLRKLFKNVLIDYRGLHGCESRLTAGDVFDTGEWPDHLSAQVDDNMRALAESKFRPYAGRIVLFRARERPLFHSHSRDLGWSRLALGGFEVINLDGNHETLFHEPHVRELARRFRAAVDAVEEGA